jgi:hypothetical protein
MNVASWLARSSSPPEAPDGSRHDDCNLHARPLDSVDAGPKYLIRRDVAIPLAGAIAGSRSEGSSLEGLPTIWESPSKNKVYAGKIIIQAEEILVIIVPCGSCTFRGEYTMTPRAIGNWADVLPVSEHAPAIAALGVAVIALSGSGADMSSPEEIAKAFKARMDGVKLSHLLYPRRLQWWQSPPDHWESMKKRLSPKIAAEAWKSFIRGNGTVEIQVGFALPQSDETFTELVPWLTELLWTEEAGVRSFFLEGKRESRRSWHWPLRLGFLPDSSSQNLMAEFAKNDHEWSITLTRSIDVAGTGQGCDLLLSPLDAAETRVLVETHGIRATTIVLLDRRPFTTVEHALAFRVLGTAARAAAIASVSNSRKVDTIVEIIRALSHNEPFDWAISHAAREGGGIPLTVADPEFIYHSHIGAVGDLWAARLDARREPGELGVSGRPSIANEIRSINSGGFFSERSDASRLAEKINEALTGADPPPRYLGATVQPVERAGEAEVPKTSASALVHNQWRLLVVNIAPRIGRQELPAFPDARIDWRQDRQTLSIVVTAPNCDLLPTSQRFLDDLRGYGSRSGETVPRLPESKLEGDGRPRDSASTQVTIYSIGRSSDALFFIRPRAAGSLKARILVVHANRVLQTAILNAEVVGGEPDEISGAAGRIDDESGESEGSIRLVPEGMIRSDMQDLEERRAFDLAILTNNSLTGKPQGTVIADDKALLQDFGEIKKIADRVGTRLKEMVEAPKEFRGAGSEAMAALLRTLANDGVLIRRYLSDAGLKSILDRNPDRIQVVAAKPDEVLPVEFIYDGKAPDPKTAEICPNQAKALDDGSCGTCPNSEASSHVCAVRFWGVRKVIERHIFGKKRPSTEGKDEVTAKAPSLDRDRIKRPATRLFASSQRAENFTGGPVALSELVQRLKGSTKPAGEAFSASKWAQWRAFVRQSSPSLCVLLPHTDVDNENDVIEIGTKDFLTNAQIDEDVVGTNHPVIVILLGCETARPELRLASFVASFRHAGADVVIGTLTPILGRHAAPVANALIEQLDQFWDGSCRVTTIGDALKNVRRTFMSAGLPIGLTLVAFGDADWLIGE